MLSYLQINSGVIRSTGLPKNKQKSFCRTVIINLIRTPKMKFIVMSGKFAFILAVVLSWMLLSERVVHAQNFFYVRSGASGSQDGTDWNKAYPSLPQALERGATYYIADGTYESYTFDDQASGTVTITIKKATDSDHGTNTGWQSSYGDGKAVFGPITFTTSYWVFDGMMGGGPEKWKTGFGFEITPSNSNSNCITLSGALDSITIRHVDAHVYPEGTPKLSMSNYYHVLKGTTGACSNISISHCYFHNVYGVMLQLASQWPGPLTIEYSYFAQNRSTPEQHAEGIACHGANNVTVRYNIWEDIEGTAFIAGIEVGEMNYWDLYGNVFVHTGNYGAAVSAIVACANDASNSIKNNHWRVYNNSFINIKGRSALIWADPNGSDIVVKNNLWYGNRIDNSYTNYVFISGAGVSYDYNWYSATAHPGFFNPGQHENAIVWGPNCKLATDTTDYFVDWKNGKYSLNRETSPGTPLSAPFNMDIVNAMRGNDNTWDRGAYEFSSKTTSPLSPPSNLKAIGN